MNDVLIMAIICISVMAVEIILFGAVILWIGNKLIDMEARRENEGICE